MSSNDLSPKTTWGEDYAKQALAQAMELCKGVVGTDIVASFEGESGQEGAKAVPNCSLQRLGPHSQIKPL